MTSWGQETVRLLLFVLFAPVSCNLTAATNCTRRASSTSTTQYALSGVWAGISIVSCRPYRMTGPWRFGSRAHIKLTLIQTPAAVITGAYASVRTSTGSAFEQTGRIVEVHVKGATRLWLRVILRDHSSCLFNSNLPDVEMRGSYLCFPNTTSAERGHWEVWRSY